ncbi:Uu.00g009100.m01.CDS01 [Anthostomella pinea]|uniref:Uu.00g009100.m01.CDS01 n=1 Tax=Anthostomella pinea TaxID=933095 RepID=A0AAI8VRK7_9PEZI|nr:Uu.00g009100.m01.CDS01 [Anthostomella pinea]
MTIGIPAEAHGAAAGVLLYSLIYVAWIAYFTLISTTASIIQQFHVYVKWESVMTQQFHHARANAGNPELVIANSSTGVDLVLFYIQFCCYNIEATSVLFWAFSLTQSVYGWSTKPHLRLTLKHIQLAGKVISIVLPIVMISLLQAKAVRSSFIAFLLIADILLIINLAGGCSFLFAILWRYIQSRRQCQSWSVGYGKCASVPEGGQNTGSSQQKPQSSIYDRWLITRFTIGFVFLGIFELSNVLFQLAARQNTSIDETVSRPDLSTSRAQKTAVLFLPGLTPPLLAFFVFGTTRTFRQYMYKTFVPIRFQRNMAQSSRSASVPYASRGPGAFTPVTRHVSTHATKHQESGITLTEMGTSRVQRKGPDDNDDEWPMLESGAPSIKGTPGVDHSTV